MKHIITILLTFLAISLSAQEQEKEVTQFMGIPVDGTKPEMISKLEEKGFTPEQIEIDLENAENRFIKAGGKINGGKNKEKDGDYFMKGYFDGHRSKVVISSYHNKVYCIFVIIDEDFKELNAKIQYNLYVEQLSKKYKLLFNSAENIINEDLTEPFDSQNIEAKFLTAYDEYDKPHGMISLEMSHPKYKEFYLALRYYNMDNMPNGKDL